MAYKTGKKEEIINLLKSRADESMSLEEICRELLEEGKGRSTVYRLVSGLVECGLLRRISDGKTRHITYQYVGDEHCKHHLHLKCRECGRLIHLDEGISDGIKDAIVRIGGFELDEGEMLLGKCGECQTAGCDSHSGASERRSEEGTNE